MSSKQQFELGTPLFPNTDERYKGKCNLLNTLLLILHENIVKTQFIGCIWDILDGLYSRKSLKFVFKITFEAMEK